MLGSALRVFKAASTALLGESGETSVVVTLVGIPGVGDSLGDESGERYEDQDVWGPVGVISRAKDADADGFAEYMAQVRQATGEAVPLAGRDKRIAKRYPNPKKGTSAVVGYGGGFVAVDPSGTISGDVEMDIITLYVPYDFTGSVPAKALVLTLDPTTESVLLLHGDGYAVGLTADDGIKLRASGSAWATFKPGSTGDGVFTLVSAKINLRGSVALGADTATALPLLPGAASQPTPSVFFSVT